MGLPEMHDKLVLSTRVPGYPFLESFTLFLLKRSFIYPSKLKSRVPQYK